MKSRKQLIFDQGFKKKFFKHILVPFLNMLYMFLNILDSILDILDFYNS